MDGKLIVTLSKRFKLFKPPNRIGDILEYQETEYLIIGIEKVSLFGTTLTVSYTCQNLSVEYEKNWSAGIDDNVTEFTSSYDIPKLVDGEFGRNKKMMELGKTFEYEGEYYRWLTYSDLEFEFTTLKVNALAMPIAPTPTNKTKRKLIDHKVKKLGLILL